MENVLRCPGCSAVVRPGAQWCSLCYRDLRPAPEPVTAAVPSPRSAQARPAAGGAAATAGQSATDGQILTRGGWPCGTCTATVPLQLDTCPDCGSAFLARLAGDGGRHRAADRKAGADALRAMPRSARLITGLVLGILIAVLLPVLLALLG